MRDRDTKIYQFQRFRLQFFLEESVEGCFVRDLAGFVVSCSADRSGNRPGGYFGSCLVRGPDTCYRGCSGSCSDPCSIRYPGDGFGYNTNNSFYGSSGGSTDDCFRTFYTGRLDCDSRELTPVFLVVLVVVLVVKVDNVLQSFPTITSFPYGYQANTIQFSDYIDYLLIDL